MGEAYPTRMFADQPFKLPFGTSKTKELKVQELGVVPSVLTIGCFALGLMDGYSVQGVVLALFAGYLYADFWMWLLHCYLDRVENLKSSVGLVSRLAHEFQDHHNKPLSVLHDNHVESIYELCTVTAGVAMLLTPFGAAPYMKLCMGSMVCSGAAACANHYFCHAATQNVLGKETYNIPPFYAFCHKHGLLPTPKHHKTHHTAPFEENWNFLNGLRCVYEPLYELAGKPFLGMQVAFYCFNPASVQLVCLGLHKAGLI